MEQTIHWDWTDWFDKFGFGDGDGHGDTDYLVPNFIEAMPEVKEVLTGEWGIHNRWLIEEIVLEKGQKLLADKWGCAFGYASCRDYLPKWLIDRCDKEFGGEALSHYEGKAPSFLCVG